jgi:hypothetical protein
VIRGAPLAAAAAAALLAGCGDGSGAGTAGPAKGKPVKEAGDPKPAARPWPKLPHCPQGAANCASARGTVIYVEAVDPDGDGDAHFVLTSAQSVTAPGLTVIDCEKSLRPKPLPEIGDRIAAAGPVYRGSHGQQQIQATVLRVRRADR